MIETKFLLNRSEKQIVRVLIYDNCNIIDLEDVALKKWCMRQSNVKVTESFQFLSNIFSRNNSYF